MPITNGYATLADLKAVLGIPTGDTGEDARLEALITAASRAIDDRCQRRFYADTETRRYTPDADDALDVDDLLSVAELATDEAGDRGYATVWDAGLDYALEPANAPLRGEPYRRIEADPVTGRRRFPLRARAVRVTGSFGYCADGAHPAPVREACLRLAERLYKLKDAPLGVVAVAGGMGNAAIMRVQQDRDLAELLDPYARLWLVA